MIRCGLYEVDITPALGMEMPGHFVLRHAEGILEKTYAYAAVFEDETGRAALITCDLIGLAEEFVLPMRQKVAQRIATTTDRVMICCTHTHYGGPCETWGEFVHVNPAYIAFVSDRLADAATCALADAREVRLGARFGVETTIAHYRDFVLPDGRYQTNSSAIEKKAFGEIDPAVGVLRIDTADGSPYGLIANYACHCDSVGKNGFRMISSDYPGAMREALRRTYGQGFMPLFVNGFCGNINHVDFENHKSDEPMYYRRMGRVLAAAVAEAYEKIRPTDGGVVRAAAESFTLPSRLPNEAELAWAKTVKTEDGVIDNFYSSEIQRIAEVGVREIPVTVQALRLGDLIVCGLPGEIYVEFGKTLRERLAGYPCFPANLANGNVGYVAIRELFQPGIYETRLCCSADTRPDAGYILTDRVAALAESLL